ncbi:MAG: hypothetical protein JWR63_2385 [Conexibacter sp.]|nr:hypothetical protein [Conexibacter sp.]
MAAATLTACGTAQAADSGHGGGDQRPLREYAQRTWASMAAMTDASSGLPADILNADGTTSVQTSTTNIGAYLWSAVAARRLGIIGDRELVARLTTTIGTLEHMERFGDTGQFYNWYDHRTGAKLTAWPPAPADEFHPILSSVDNGWLAVGLRIVQRSVPQLSRRAGALYDAMDFGFYYRPDVNRVLFHYRPDDPAASPCCYDTLVSESRIVDYLGITKGQLPPKEYYGRVRTFPDTCPPIQEQRPTGTTQTYFGVPVYEGAYTYNNTKLVPSWGGSMFEALMPDLFVPEERWAPDSWGTNHPRTVQAQIHHGLVEAGYGYWGFSPSNTPEGGYGAYGVDAIGMDPNGNPSNEDRTLVDHGYPGCPDPRPAQPDPPPSAYTNGVVTPHAAFLGLRYAPREALDDVARLARDFPDMYGKWGFRDSVNVQTGHVSGSYLSLDQGMIMASLGNALGGDVLRDAFAGREEARALKPVIGIERFSTSGR